MGVNVGSATGYLDLDVSGFLSGLRTAETEGKKAENRFQAVGSKVSTVGEKMSKVGGTMTKTFTIPMVTALTAVVNSYAKMEQAIGGVETLFKESAREVVANSETAYIRAGVNGTEYMEQVVSFSARLLQGLGGDTVEAARVADMAMVDMSDNANKFGTDIGAIQSAYQGFAKANFTMLDNLKLGYGGTAGEMARLVNESGVLEGSMTATADNIKDMPFDVLIKAINATQKRMGIFGTTATEATETVSGSFGMLKASVGDFLAGMGGADADVKRLSKNMVESFRSFATNIVRVLRNIWDNLPLDDTTKKIIGIVAVAGPITVIIGKIVTVIGGLITSIGAIRTAMTLLAANPVMLWILGGTVAIAAIAAVVTAITSAVDKANTLKQTLANIDMSVSEEAQTEIGKGIDKGIELANKTFEIQLAVDAEVSKIEEKVETAFGAVITGAKKKLSAAELKTLKSEVSTFVGGAIDEVITTTETKAKEVAAAMDALGVDEAVKNNAVAEIKANGDATITDLQTYETAATKLLTEMGKAGDAVTQDQLTAFNELMRQIGLIKTELGLAQEGMDGYITALRDRVQRGTATTEEQAIVITFDVQMAELETAEVESNTKIALDALGVRLQNASDENKPAIQQEIDLLMGVSETKKAEIVAESKANVLDVWEGAVNANTEGAEKLRQAAMATDMLATIQTMFDQGGFHEASDEVKAAVGDYILALHPDMTPEDLQNEYLPLHNQLGTVIDNLNQTIANGAEALNEDSPLSTALTTMLQQGALTDVDLSQLSTTLQGAMASIDLKSNGGYISDELFAGLNSGIGTGAATSETEMATAATSIIDKAKSEFGVQSPSTVFDEIGQNNMLGLDQGHVAGAAAVEANLTTLAETMWSGVKTAFDTQIAAILLSVDTAFGTMPAAIAVHTVAIDTNITTWGTEMSTKSQSIGEDFALKMDTAIAELVDDIKTTTNTINTNLTTWGTKMSTKAKSIGDDFVLKVTTAVDTLPGKITTQTDLIVSNLVTWGTNMGLKGTAAGNMLTNNTVTATDGLPDKLKTIGSNSVVGFWNGMDGKSSWLQTQAKKLVADMIKAMKKEAGVNSPSTVLRDELGVFMPPGIAVGFVNALPAAMKVMQTALTKGITSMESPDFEVNSLSGIDVFVNTLKNSYEQIAIWFESIETRMVRSIGRMSTTLDWFAGRAGILAGDGGVLGAIPAGGFGQSVRVEWPDGPLTRDVKSDGGDTFNFYSNRSISEVEAARLLKQAKRDMAEGFE